MSTSPVPTLAFTPVPRKCRRHDGWTPARQRGFIAALAETGSVTAAARAVNMAHATAYDLYNHPDAASFRAAWDHALSLGVGRLQDTAMERALTGVPSPVFYKGEQCGERRLFSDHLLVKLLAHHAGHYGASPVGRRSRASIERHAAENCPTCRDRREIMATRDAASLISVRRKIDALRGHLLASLAQGPLTRAAWELIVGPTDWATVAGWDGEAPTQFYDDNMTEPSTIVALALPVDENGERASDVMFGGGEGQSED